MAMTNSNAAQPSRAGTTALIAVAVLGALGVNYLFSSSQKALERDDALMTAHMKERQCVIADTNGRAPSLYRCDRPVVNEYVDASALRAEARGSAK